jgi:glycosyltransferase involved in cell wall biosynthesis
MPSHKYNLLFDVTQLVHWQGKLTGIPRVMNELAIRYAKREDINVTFVSWVKELKDFCEVDLMTTLSHRGQRIDYATVSTNVSSNYKKVAKRALRSIDKLRPGLYEKAVQKTNKFRYKNYKSINIQKGDVLLIPWGEWWDENFIVKLEELVVGGVQLVQVLHDMTPIVVPQFAGHSTESFPVYCKQILPISKLVLSNSQCSKRDAIKWLKEQNLPVPNIEVFRLGDDFEVAEATRPIDPKFKNSGLKGNDYILCVGTIEARKNHTLLYYVYKHAYVKDIELPKLIIVGRRGWGTENIFDVMTTDPETKNKIIFLLDTTDQELSWLYDHCLFSIFPSFYEGWGIPIAESVSRGVPCLCSNTSSMVEIAEGFVQYMAPTSVDECLEGIQHLLNPDNLHVARERAASYKQHSWDESFKQVNAYLENME